MISIDVKDVLTEFLRIHVDDPRVRLNDNTTQFTSQSGQSEFNLPSDNVAVSKVEVNSQEQNKFVDYFIDYNNNLLYFPTPLNYNDVVDVYYKESTNSWIFPDKPDKKLSSDDFPAIDILTITGDGFRQGNYQAPVETASTYQIDVFTKPNQDFDYKDINPIKGEYLARYLSNQIIKAFKDNEHDLDPILYNFTLPKAPTSLPFDEERQSFHKAVEIGLKTLYVEGYYINN